MYRKVTKEELDEIFDGLKKEFEDCEFITYPKIDLDFIELYPEVKTPSNCLHDNCSECHGSGRKSTGEACIHFISCPCPKCTPQC